jgi:hypothetical protein
MRDGREARGRNEDAEHVVRVDVVWGQSRATRECPSESKHEAHD